MADDKSPHPEALAIFARAHFKLSPNEYYEDTANAAVALRDAVADAARVGGYDVFQNSGWISVTQRHQGSVGIQVDDNKFVLVAEHARIPLAIEYDPATKSMVGAEVDAEVAPEPGKRRPKRSAVAVVAAAIVEAIAKQAAAKQQQRR
jgi:hypothetical protein